MTTEEQITKTFRKSLKSFNVMADPKNYEYLDGELWYGGHPIERHMTENETRCLDYAVRVVLNNMTNV